MPGFSEFLFGTPERMQQVQRFTPEQQQALDVILKQVLSSFQNNQFDFGPIAQQARTNFQQQTIPSIAERFTSMGGQGSSAFKQSLGQAGANLEGNLAALQSQYNLQKLGQMQGFLGMGMAPRFETAYQPSAPGFLEAVGGPVLGGLSHLLAPLFLGSRLMNR